MYLELDYIMPTLIPALKWTLCTLYGTSELNNSNILNDKNFIYLHLFSMQQ